MFVTFMRWTHDGPELILNNIVQSESTRKSREKQQQQQTLKGICNTFLSDRKVLGKWINQANAGSFDFSLLISVLY